MTENSSPDMMDLPALQMGAAERLLPRLEPKTHVATEGEKRFNYRAYNLIGYIANALISVAGIYWVERTHSGRKSMDWWGDIFKNKLGLNAERAKFFSTKSFFLSGGFAVLLPIQWMEHHKVNIVEKWDREIYGDRVDTDPAIRQSHRELEAEPKQTWGSISASRALALVPFYITIGLLWNRTSLLSRFTNPAIRGKGKEALAAMEQSLGTTKFNEVASKGIYFDRPIAWASRQIGKGMSWIAGNEKAMSEINQMEKQYPGMIHQSRTGMQDPNHSVVPYYFISESITSGMVAWGVFALTRVLGPVFGKKAEPVAPVATSPSPVAEAPLQTKFGLPVEEHKPKGSPVPGTKVMEVHHTPQPARELAVQSL